MTDCCKQIIRIILKEAPIPSHAAKDHSSYPCKSQHHDRAMLLLQNHGLIECIRSGHKYLADEVSFKVL